MNLNDDITNIKGVGEKTALLFEKVGVSDVESLINYYPRGYCHYERLSAAGDFSIGNVCAFTGRIMSRPLIKKVKRLSITTVKIISSGTLITATWFHMPYLSKMLTVGRDYVFRGKITSESDHFHVEQPQIFSTDEYGKLEGKIAPVYSLTKGLSNKTVIKTVKTAFDETGEDKRTPELYTLHFPESDEALIKARSSLVYDEFLLFVLRLRMLKEENEIRTNHFKIIETGHTLRIIEKLPYRLTGAQQKVWNEVKSDLGGERSMSRLVQGDVGSGKTIIAVLAAVMTASCGYQTAVMAPTEILAAQHMETFTRIIRESGLDIKTILLTGSVTQANKKKIREEIESGSAQIIIGTHALITDNVVYDNLALVITDEQHRFGVAQREKLIGKNGKACPHLLVMSATPIPRTLAIILYGDLSLSLIDELPAHKLPIKNAVVDESYRRKSYDFMRKEIAAGRQVYIICPLAEESEGIDAKNAVDYADEIRPYFDDSVNIACLHGKMKAKTKQSIMNDFENNNIQILVSTTVVEVGVNIPNATVMMIENSERFGLAQLHQLRGRIGRGQYQSYCIFINCSSDKKAQERLNILKETNDGFKIADEDLKSRGPGDLFGLRQSGEMQFRLADVFEDALILKKASEDADRILSEDPDLSKDEHAMLKERLDRFIEKFDITKSI